VRSVPYSLRELKAQDASFAVRFQAPSESVYRKLQFVCSLVFCSKALLKCTYYLSSNEILEGKAIPLQALTGPEDSRRVRLPYINL
jgi:hypothetical protein